MKVSELKSLLEGMSDYDDVTVNFLSRLCGGERLINLKCIRLGFLSRLCGGEHQSC